MKIFKKFLSLLICTIMVVSSIGVAVCAANGEPNVSLSVGPNEVNVGDDITVTVSCSDMRVSSFATSIQFDDDLLECVSVKGMRSKYPERGYLQDIDEEWVRADMSTAANANANGYVGFVVTGTEDWDYMGSVVFTATFTAKASGEAVFTLEEDSSGADGYKNVVEVAKVTIASSEPECEHPDTTTTYSKIDGENKHTVTVTCNDCTETVSETIDDCSGGTADCINFAVCDYCEEAYGDKDSNNHISTTDPFYEPNNDGTHKIWSGCWACDTKLELAEESADCYDMVNNASGEQTPDGKCDACFAEMPHTCSLTHVPAADATCVAGGNIEYWYCAECGEYYSDAEGKYVIENKESVVLPIDKNNGHAYKLDSYTDNRDGTHTANYKCENDEFHTYSLDPVSHDFANGDCVCGAVKPVTYNGWTEINGELYHYKDNAPLIGLQRLPYAPGYGPNEDDMEMAAGEDASGYYTDAETAVFVLDEKTGKLCKDFTGIKDGHYAVNGMIAWHPGAVVVDGETYYFVGDTSGAKLGNIAANGNVYVTRTNSSDLDDGLYYFVNGKVDTNINGFHNGYYYENGRVVYGLVYYNDSYYYVRTTNGELVTGKDYWVSRTNGLLPAGLYTFDNDGKIMIPEAEEGYDGIVEIDGVLYYYVDGIKMAGAGVVEMTDDNGETFYIYVKTDGKLATGIYWPTKINGELETGAYNWGTNGRYYPGK